MNKLELNYRKLRLTAEGGVAVIISVALIATGFVSVVVWALSKTT